MLGSTSLHVYTQKHKNCTARGTHTVHTGREWQDRTLTIKAVLSIDFPLVINDSLTYHGDMSIKLPRLKQKETLFSINVHQKEVKTQTLFT